MYLLTCRVYSNGDLYALVWKEREMKVQRSAWEVHTVLLAHTNEKVCTLLRSRLHHRLGQVAVSAVLTAEHMLRVMAEYEFLVSCLLHAASNLVETL